MSIHPYSVTPEAMVRAYTLGENTAPLLLWYRPYKNRVVAMIQEYLRPGEGVGGAPSPVSILCMRTFRMCFQWEEGMTTSLTAVGCGISV